MQIPLVPFPLASTKQWDQDPAQYAKSIKIQAGAPLSGEITLIPDNILNRSSKDIVGLMDAPARAALSELKFGRYQRAKVPKSK